MRRTYANRTDAQGPAATAPGKLKPDQDKPKEGHRETVEAIVVAMILALLVRGFEAEAFVIPTGSMAPTLMGRHKEITCPQCGFVYSVNASDEDEGRAVHFRSGKKNRFIVGGTCVNCRFQANIADAPTFNGDRILVMKFPYDLPNLPGSSGPRRWDVVVFRYPEEPEVSYIKRLIGLPGEEVRVYFGDIYVKPPGAKEFQLARKPLGHQEAMQISVYDDAHRPAALKDQPEWRRWTSKTPDAWKEAEPGKFVAAARPGEEAELRYRHLVPDPEQWRAIVAGESLPHAPRSTLITDFYSYNTNLTAGSPNAGVDVFRDADGGLLQPHWVGDLTVSGTLEVKSAGGSVRLELIKAGVPNRCEIDLATGEATLSHGDEVLGRRSTSVNKPGTYAFRFANVDDRLTLVVDGRLAFGDGLTYDQGKGRRPPPTAADLSPVGVVARGADVAVTGLALKRDIYYTQYPGRSDYSADGVWDNRYPRTATELFDLLADTSRFADLGNLSWQDYPLGADRFMMMGDNSPRSKDSRGWSHDDAEWDPSHRALWEVPRSMLTGKAFFIYWPHGQPFWPNIRINHDLRVPFLPYFGRMRWIR